MTEEIIDKLDNYRLPRMAEYKKWAIDDKATRCIVLAFVPATNGIEAVIEIDGKLDSVFIERLTMI